MPLRPETLEHDPEDSHPPSRVRPLLHGCTEAASSTGPGPLKAGLHRLSTASLLPWPWSAEPKPLTPDLRSLGVRGKRRFSEEIASSSEVSCLLENLVTSESPQARAYGFTSKSGSRLRSPFFS
jgi:hypothetical protein